MSRTRKRTEPGPLREPLIAGLAAIVVDVRPSWDESTVHAILAAHRTQVDAPTLVRVAVEVADDPDVYDPRAIGWSLRRSSNAPLPRCDVCQQPADRCARRPGADDDHVFTPIPVRAS